MSRIVCEICGRGPQDGITVFRANPKGEIGIWRCKDHPCYESLESQIATQHITDAIEIGKKVIQ